MESPLTDMQLAMETIRRMPRTLDTVPNRVTLETAKSPMPCGYKASFISLFQSNASESNEESYSIEIQMNNKKIECTAGVFCLLKTLVMSNVCKSPDYSQACTDLFTAIVLCNDKKITEIDAYEVIKKAPTDTYERKILVESITEVMFSESGVLIEWAKIYNSVNLYPNLNVEMIKLITNGKWDTAYMNKTLQGAYKEAKADEAFMKSLVKGLSNHKFIGALYLLRKDNPDVMIVHNVDDGFMNGGC